MKKVVSLIMITVLAAICCFNAFSASSIIIPDVLTVVGEENGGYLDYSFEDGHKNEFGIFESKSYLPKETLTEYESRGISNASLCTVSEKNESPFPESYDSRNLGLVTCAKKQGLSNNCWSFSAMSMLETDAIIKGIDEGDANYSEAHLAWFTLNSLTDDENDPTFGDGQINPAPFEKGGNWIIAAGALARWTGVANDYDYPFISNDFSSMGFYDESCRYDTGSGIIINSAEELKNIDDAKEWIMTHGSASFAYHYDSNYYNSSECTYYYNGEKALNHVITVVGWDDNFSAKKFGENAVPENNGAWLCKNSWGEGWGNQGFFWISYYDSSISQFAGISARAADDFLRNYTYNGTGWESYIEHSGNAGVSNVFTAKGSEILTAVSTYSMAPEQTVKIKIYNNLPENYQSPECGELACEFSTVMNRAGYHTIELENDVLLDEGALFSVVVEYVTSDTVYIPIESNGKGVNAYSCNEGESFVNLPDYNEGWLDVTDYGFQNVFVQAFTECNHVVDCEILEPLCVQSGRKTETCDICGRTVSDSFIPAMGHDFSEWSEYRHDFEHDCEVSTRSCLKCGYTETSTIFYVKNRVTIDALIQMIFERIIAAIRQIFG